MMRSLALVAALAVAGCGTFYEYGWNRSSPRQEVPDADTVCKDKPEPNRRIVVRKKQLNAGGLTLVLLSLAGTVGSIYLVTRADVRDSTPAVIGVAYGAAAGIAGLTLLLVGQGNDWGMPRSFRWCS